eukprot:m.202849 g.202849  ORF g.202849 m.202849 type:complete len:846 (-) comp32836_c0_seq1:65-2602(-)
MHSVDSETDGVTTSRSLNTLPIATSDAPLTPTRIAEIDNTDSHLNNQSTSDVRATTPTLSDDTSNLVEEEDSQQDLVEVAGDELELTRIGNRWEASNSPVNFEGSCFGCIPILLGDSEDDDWVRDLKPSSAKLSFSTRRLFESKWFNMAMAISYLHQYTDEDTQEYLCARMKAFDCQTIEFWFPQLFALYLRQETSADRTETSEDFHLFGFIVERCTRYVKFALVTHWWITAHLSLMPEGSAELKPTEELLHRIETSVPRFPIPLDEAITPTPDMPRKRHGHRRAHSSGALNMLLEGLEEAPTSPVGKFGKLPTTPPRLQSRVSRLDSGLAFEWPQATVSRSKSTLQLNLMNPTPPQQKNVDKKKSVALNLFSDTVRLGECMRAQQNFVSALVNLGTKLVQYETKDVRRTQLYAELALINLNLPARVYIPLRMPSEQHGEALESRTQEHHVVRFPPQEAAILNSRDRVPYLLYVEVLDCEHCHTSPVPPKLTVPQPQNSPDRPKSPNLLVENLPLAAAETDKANKDGFVEATEIRRSLVKASRVRTFGDGSDLSARASKEPWHVKVQRIQQSSPYGHLSNWRLVPVIVKTGDDLRQELLASQIMSVLQGAWAAERLKLWIRPLQILVTCGDGGLIEVVGSAVSIHQIKKHSKTLLEFFVTEFGSPTSEGFLAARRNFAESLAGYSLFCYFTQVRDRHNSNILVDGDGHILHIDFGFMLSRSNSPGGGMNFEKAPFKLTYEHIEVLGGWDSDMLTYFRLLILKGFIAARKHIKSLIPVIEVMVAGSQLPCLGDEQYVLKEFVERFQLTLTEEQLSDYVDMLINTSLESVRTAIYDRFQYYSNGILE